MRILLMFAGFTTLLAVPALAQADQIFAYDHAGVTITLPAGFVVNATCETPAGLPVREGESRDCEPLPPGEATEVHFALYSFVDMDRYAMVDVAFHNYLTEEWREQWLSGARALRGLVGEYTLVEASKWSATATGAASWAEAMAAGIVVYGCEEWRCYRIFVNGLASDFEADADFFRALIAGVEIEPLSEPVTINLVEEGTE